VPRPWTTTFRSSAYRASRNIAIAVAFALPLIFLAVWANSRGFTSPSLAWIVNRSHIATTGPGFSHLDYVYPITPVVLALIVPGGAFGLAIITCLFMGATLAILAHRLGLTRAVVLLPLIAVPAMWYAASEVLAQVVGLTFLAVSLGGFIRFAQRGETYGGFICGLALAVSYSADPGALLYAGVMCAFVPLISDERYHGDPQAPVGVCAVLVFPCLALAASWSFLIWKFTGNWPGNLDYSVHADVLGFPYGVLDGLGRALANAFSDLARAPLYVVAAVVLAVHRRLLLPGIGLLLPVLALALALWLGFDYTSVTAYFMLTVLAVTVISENQLMDNRTVWVILAAAAIAQVIVAIVWPPYSAGFSAWGHAVFG
jgi:hypothetical protein